MVFFDWVVSYINLYAHICTGKKNYGLTFLRMHRVGDRCTQGIRSVWRVPSSISRHGEKQQNVTSLTYHARLCRCC
jgi:hypothetical protein